MHDLAPVLESLIHANKKYLNVIISSTSAIVKTIVRDDVEQYVIYRVGDLDAGNKIWMLEELGFVTRGNPLPEEYRRPRMQPLQNPIVAGEHLETILRWGVAEVELVDDEYVVTAVETSDMVLRIGHLESLGLVEKAPQVASA